MTDREQKAAAKAFVKRWTGKGDEKQHTQLFWKELLQDEVKKFRLNSVKAATRQCAEYPYRFMEIKQPDTDYILVPLTSSERRKYIPMGYVDKNVVASNLASFVPNATLYHFGILTSSVHMAWMRAVCGRLEMRYRYSNTIVYNTFPWCDPKPEQIPKIEKTAQNILDVRAKYPNDSLADFYDDSAMKEDLRKARSQEGRQARQEGGDVHRPRRKGQVRLPRRLLQRVEHHGQEDGLQGQERNLFRDGPARSRRIPVQVRHRRHLVRRP